MIIMAAVSRHITAVPTRLARDGPTGEDFIIIDASEFCRGVGTGVGSLHRARRG
jgi:hypothetical protein